METLIWEEIIESLNTIIVLDSPQNQEVVLLRD